MLRSFLASVALVAMTGLPALAQTLPCAPSAGCPTLTLDETLRRVARAHPTVRSAALERDLADAEILGARGGFDPLLSTGLTYKTDDFNEKLGVLESKLSLPFDAPFSPSLDLNHRLGGGKSVNPADRTEGIGETRLGVSFSPLGGRRTDSRRTALERSRLAAPAAEATVTLRTNKLLLDAAKAYWAWASAWEAVAVRDELLRVARARAAFVARRVRVGAEAPIDSVEARLAVTSREGDLVSALRAAESAGVQLATYFWDEEGDPAPLRAVPAPLPTLPPLPESLNDTLIGQALASRPEVEAARLQREQAEIDARLARQQLLPDLRVGVQAVSFGDAPARFDDVYVGFSVRQPLAFRPGRAAVARARVGVGRRAFDQDLAARSVTADVEDALVTLRRADDRVRLAAEQVELAQTLLQAETRRFELGEGTLFLVNQRESSLAQARLREIQARTDYLQAIAVYEWATGRIGPAEA